MQELRAPVEVDYVLQRNASFAKSFPTAIPPPMEVNSVYLGPGGERQEINIHFENSDYGSSKNIMRIKPVSQEFLDFRRCNLYFKAGVTSTGGTYTRFVNGIWNLIKDVRVYWNGNLVSEEMDKSQFRSMNYNFNRDKSADPIFAEQYGVGTQAERGTWSAGKVYSIPLNIPLLEQEEIPMWRCKELVIEFNLNQPSRCLETDATQYDYWLKDPYLRLDEVKYEPSYKNQMNNKRLKWAHTSYHSYTFNNQSSHFQGLIAHKTQGVERIFAFIRDTADLTDPTANDVNDTFKYDNLNTYQFKIDNTFIPKEPVKASNQSLTDNNKYYEAYQSMLYNTQRSFLNDSLSDKYRSNVDIPVNYWYGLPVTPQQYVTDKFLITQDFMTFLYNSEEFISKQDWSIGNVNVTLDLKFNSAPANHQTIQVFVIHKSTFVILENDDSFIIE